jgi:hypothetical protein
MANTHRTQILNLLRQRFGEFHKLGDGNSLFAIGEDAARIYLRYSKLHVRGRNRMAFFGLRDVDLRQLEGHNSFICLFLDDDSPPLFVPYADFEEVFRTAQVASDGQYKVYLFSQQDALEMAIPRVGRFNVEGYVGYEALERSLDAKRLRDARDLTHSQVQTLLAGIGYMKGYSPWVPENDIGRLDWSLTDRFNLCRNIPPGFDDVKDIISGIDVLWLVPGSNTLEGLFEVEHSTPVFSGLLRFNDVLLTHPQVNRFSIVSNDPRRALFSRQVSRPTFRQSRLAEFVSFLEYANVFDWHARLLAGIRTG